LLDTFKTSLALENATADFSTPNANNQQLGTGKATAALSKIVKELVLRFPRLHCMELGAGNSPVTGELLSEIGTIIPSYTCTDATLERLHGMIDLYAPYYSCMSFKALNIKHDPVLQDCVLHSYDVVVTYMCLSVITRPLLTQSKPLLPIVGQRRHVRLGNS
jgi:hypothetical protein